MRPLFFLIIFTLSWSAAFAQNVLSESERRSCQLAYERLYEETNIRMSLFIGYGDFGNQTEDLRLAELLGETLIEPCTGETNLCGFAQDIENPEHYRRQILGPDGKPRQIRLQVLSSSYSPSNKLNKGDFRTQQNQKSQETQRKFLEALTKDHVVLYEGHARYGAGPGFKPVGPFDLVKNMFYRFSINDAVKALKSTNTPPKLIGIFACQGERHYGRILHQASPTSALVLTRQTMINYDTYKAARATLNGLLGMQCQGEFRKALDNTVSYFVRSKVRAAPDSARVPEIYGFFEPLPKKFGARYTIPGAFIRGYLEKNLERSTLDPKEFHLPLKR